MLLAFPACKIRSEMSYYVENCSAHKTFASNVHPDISSLGRNLRNIPLCNALAAALTFNFSVHDEERHRRKEILPQRISFKIKRSCFVRLHISPNVYYKSTTMEMKKIN